MGITPKDPADFDPTMGNYKDLRPFRFWCQKVLPLVYDDSLSYYEVLCKVVDYLNKAIEDIGVLHEDVDALHVAYQQLQSYVNDYFSTLDVQQEINNKLDDMASDGTLDALILPYFNAYKEEINGIVANQTQTINSQNSNISSMQNKINTLEDRMDSFSSLTEGSTTGDAELADIRVGANGITYPTAGDAVRGQYNTLQNDISLINGVTFGVFSSGYIDCSGSTVDINSVISHADYKHAIINCSYGDVITISGLGGGNPRLWCFIDNLGNVIKKSGEGEELTLGQITTPYGATKIVINTKGDKFALNGKTSYNFNKDNLNAIIHSNNYLKDLSWGKGGLSATGNYSHDDNEVCVQEIIYECSYIKIAEGAKARLFIYDANYEYMGKISSSGALNTAPGYWYEFEGIIPIGAILEQYGGSGIRLSLLPNDGTTLIDSNARSWANNHVMCYTGYTRENTETLLELGVQKGNFITPSWSKGVRSATGFIVVNDNGVNTNIIDIPASILLSDNCYALIGCYDKDSNYLGKFNTSLGLDSVAGRFSYFYGYIPLPYIISKYPTIEKITISLIPTDGTIITNDNIDSFVSSNITIGQPKTFQSVKENLNVLTTIADVFKIETCFIKGAMSADAHYLQNDNFAISGEIINKPYKINIKTGASAHMYLYKNGVYLGKIASNGTMNKQPGNWFEFTGETLCPPILSRFGATGIRISIQPTDSTALTYMSASNWAKEHIDVYAQNSNQVDNIYVHSISPTLYKNKLKIDTIGQFSGGHTSFCMYNNKYYVLTGTSIKVYDSEFTLESESPMYTAHANTFQLGSSNIAYASGSSDSDTIYCVNLDTLEIVDTITLPNMPWFNALVDDVNKIAYIIYPDDAEETRPDLSLHYDKFVVYDYVNSTVLFEKHLTRKLYAIQDCDFVEGKIYVPYGYYQNRPIPSGIIVLNTNGDVIGEYVIPFFANSDEPEGLFVDRQSKDLIVGYDSNSHILKIHNY